LERGAALAADVADGKGRKNKAFFFSLGEFLTLPASTK
jgi:hypothetical protein